VEIYRGISLLCTVYKIYAEVMRNSLEVEEVEEKSLENLGKSGKFLEREINNRQYVHFEPRYAKRKVKMGRFICCLWT